MQATDDVLDHNAGLSVPPAAGKFMQKTLALFFILVYSAIAAGAEVTRCGTDAFGNAVCIDKDGVLISAPSRPAAEQQSGENTDATVPTDPKGKSAERDDNRNRPRCAIDPFGNKVCRQ